MDGNGLATLVVTVVCSALTSSGLWAWLSTRSRKKDNTVKLLLGLAHDRITTLGLEFIKRGYVTKEEYDNYEKYLYRPYIGAGGNGLAEKIFDHVRSLPMAEGAE